MNIFGYDVQEGVVFIIKIIATIGGAVVGWFVCDPLTRVAYRLSFRAPTPGALLFFGKAIGGASLAAAVWFFMPEGGGGGPGFGPGKGGIPGKGAGQGGDKSITGDPAKDAKAVKDKTDAKDKSAQKLEPVEVEIIGEKLYKKLLDDDGKERWYVIKQKAYSLSELDDFFKTNRAKIEVTPVLKKDSISLGRQELHDLGRNHSVKMLQDKTP
jgi:hypothetical protein